jgi:hypothetical protein
MILPVNYMRTIMHGGKNTVLMLEIVDTGSGHLLPAIINVTVII